MQSEKIFDLLVVGGGINGTGIAFDAAGRGLSVALCEKSDLGSGTSWVSTKLIHGGLRYLEHYDFKLVREALGEREILLRNAPHLISTQRFIIPYEPSLRPRWFIRLGLWIYDHLGKKNSLPPSCSVSLSQASPLGNALIPHYQTGFAFTDCKVDDARLVIANALGAADRGALILPYTEVTSVRVEDGLWIIGVVDKTLGKTSILKARALVNATGPWIQSFIEHQPALHLDHRVRLVRGSHIIVPKRYEGDQAYLIQHEDGRIVFVIPYEDNFTLIGTTEVDTTASPDEVQISESEVDYLITVFNAHFKQTITRGDLVWHYSGVRPLIDAQGKSTALSREYALNYSVLEGAPLISVYGGKITTYRILAESVVNQLSQVFPDLKPAWTASVPLPGGEAKPNLAQYPWLPATLASRLARLYGTRIDKVLEGAHSLSDLGQYFGADCYEKELRYLIEHEWARTAEDLLFRRTKLGLHLTSIERQAVSDWLSGVL